MKQDHKSHHRRSIRMKGYDYSWPGAYFITICTHDRECLFGDVKEGKMCLNEAGDMVERCWLEIPIHFPHVELDTFQVMPNHIHGIIAIARSVGAKNFSPLPILKDSKDTPFQSPSRTIGSIVRGFKIGVTGWFRKNSDIFVIWQRNYHEHIIRNEKSLEHIREYIINNSMHWECDRENPCAVTKEPEGAWQL
jgi:putative transposase